MHVTGARPIASTAGACGTWHCYKTNKTLKEQLLPNITQN